MTIVALLIGLLAVPALFCAISGLVRFPLKSQDKAVIAQKRWKYARMASRLLVVSWTAYGMVVWSYLPRYLSPQVDRAAADILHAGALVYFAHFLLANLLGLLTSLPLALAYLLYLIAFAWSDRRIRQEDFPLGGAVRVLLFETTRTLLPYAILFLFVVSGVMPLIAVRTTLLHFNWLIAFVTIGSCSFVYFKSFDIMKWITKAVVPLRDAVLEQRVSELANAAGIKAGKLFRLRTFGYPYAQGYALSNRDICLSDHVLDVFAPAECDAVIAHELGHLKHLKTLITKRFAVYLVLVITLLFLFPLGDAYFFGNSLGFLLKLGLIYGWLLLMIQMNKSSRGYELEADTFSASVVGNEVFVRAMEKLHEVNLLPRRFDDKGKENMTHPSLEMRINAVAQSSDLSADRQEAERKP
jgi:Zn-dependent protease with chaperone function